MTKQALIESLKFRGFSSQIVNAFSKVPRENFMPPRLKHYAYEDNAFPIGHGQTISQPYTITVMLEMLKLKSGQKVLEIGSGCGYVLALISEIINSKVYGIEIVKELVDMSKKNLKNSNYLKIKVYNRNGASGLPEHAPFDRIIVSAAFFDEVPQALADQLIEKGILVAPVGPRYSQSLVAFQKQKNRLVIINEKPGFIFVPFVED